MITSVSDLAEHFSVSRQTVYNWRTAGCVIDQGEDVITAWLAEHRPEEESLAKQIQRAKLAKINHEAELASLDVQVRKGKLISTEAVRRFLNAWVHHQRGMMELWPDEFVTEVPSNLRATIHELLTDKVRTALMALANMPAEVWEDEAVKADTEFELQAAGSADHE